QEVLTLQVQPLRRREPLGARQRRRSAGKRAAELVELRRERRVRLRLAPAGLELVECRDQRLGHVAPAVGAVEAGRRHRAASTKARTFSWSLIPGADSSRDAASTAHGRTAATAARTVSGPRRPARTTRP